MHENIEQSDFLEADERLETGGTLEDIAETENSVTIGNQQEQSYLLQENEIHEIRQNIS